MIATAEPGHQRGRKVLGANKIQQGGVGCQVGDDDGRGDGGAVLSRTPVTLAFSTRILSTLAR